MDRILKFKDWIIFYILLWGDTTLSTELINNCVFLCSDVYSRNLRIELLISYVLSKYKILMIVNVVYIYLFCIVFNVSCVKLH